MTGYQRAELREMLRLPHRYLDIKMIDVGSYNEKDIVLYCMRRSA